MENIFCLFDFNSFHFLPYYLKTHHCKNIFVISYNGSLFVLSIYVQDFPHAHKCLCLWVWVFVCVFSCAYSHFWLSKGNSNSSGSLDMIHIFINMQFAHLKFDRYQCEAMWSIGRNYHRSRKMVVASKSWKIYPEHSSNSKKLCPAVLIMNRNRLKESLE